MQDCERNETEELAPQEYVLNQTMITELLENIPNHLRRLEKKKGSCWCLVNDQANDAGRITR